MKRYVFPAALVIAAAVLLAMPAFSQETREPAAPDMVKEEAPATVAEPAAPAAAAPAPASEAPAAPEAAQPKDISIYGEVLAVNASGSTMTVQYYDYDSDEEKTVELTVSGDTKLENAAALAEVKKGDWVDAAYSVSNGKNVAKAVMVEKEEAAAADTATAASDTQAADQQ